jgi:hypothetical protein
MQQYAGSVTPKQPALSLIVFLTERLPDATMQQYDD